MPAESNPLVTYLKEGPVAQFTLCAPPANTYSHQMMCALDRCILKARFDPEVEVIVITGDGDRFFCAGADISMLEGSDPTFKYYFCLHANETLSRLEQTPKLVIAALNGHTVGGGLEIAMACDLRIARKSGGKIGLPEVKLGVLPGTGGTQRLARLLGKAKAIELMISGANMSFAEAADMGLITKVIDGENFMTEVMTMARSYCTPGTASMAVGHIKRAVQTGAELPLESGLALERELQAKLFASGDAAEGLAAYNQRRDPAFKGK